LLAFLAFCS